MDLTKASRESGRKFIRHYSVFVQKITNIFFSPKLRQLTTSLVLVCPNIG